ncbi:hypothetical protein TSUD_282790 [Trifolium subterraneum]|uniref:Uncharacterized protein n=1 Tax=Trifolium subterraneum TaxID=3900 RepID=A0A2Z6NYK6_TRISU|nr:hypothetical protein TSUD_282790 [Trifolium subterraneum]
MRSQCVPACFALNATCNTSSDVEIGSEVAYVQYATSLFLKLQLLTFRQSSSDSEQNPRAYSTMEVTWECKACYSFFRSRDTAMVAQSIRFKD